jgi:hypothetical protein
MISSFTKRVLDGLGLTLSILCAVHCLVTPIALIALPALGSSWHEDQSHLFFLVISAFVVGILLLRSLANGASLQAMAPLVIGLACLAIGLGLEEDGHATTGIGITMLGSGFLGWAHYRNLKQHQHGSAPVSSPFDSGQA